MSRGLFDDPLPAPPGNFRSGDRLIVDPKTEDDPEAQALKGRPCEFRRYVPATSFRACFAVVRFDPKGKEIYFRAEDLRKEGQ